MKQVAMGRKAWLFVCSVAGGEQSAKMMTLVSSAGGMISTLGSTSKTCWTSCSPARRTTTACCPTSGSSGTRRPIRDYRVEERRDKAERKQLNAARRRLAARAGDSIVRPATSNGAGVRFSFSLTFPPG